MHPNTLITIDYLIINLKGMMTEIQSTTSNFQFIASSYGTKTFANKFTVFYKEEKIATLVNTPRSNIIPEDLNQLQFENHVFYTKTLKEIRSIIEELTDCYNVEFEAINRLDIAFDINDNDSYYRALNSSLNDGSIRLSGRKKAFNQYNELVKGVCINNGFTLGQRSSSKMLRVYNKTLSLQIAEKPHIIEHYKNNNFSNENVWRFEYQLNASFFSNLKDYGHDKDFFDVAGEKLVLPFQDVTYSIFDYTTLIELVSMAQNNFFVLKENTGKKQINAENTIAFILDFDYLKTFYGTYQPTLMRLKTTHVPNLTKRKRLAKSLFREYCANFQNVTYVLALNRLLDEMNPFDNSPLHDWFSQKMPFYLAEFKEVEKMNNRFDFKLFDEQKKLFLAE
jgi:hypothetical protein